MREILFRGKTDKGEWVQGSLIKRKIGCFIVDENNQCALRKATEYLFDFESKLVIHETIGQYTGLTDKNGTKIFEGDIITAEIYEREYEDEYLSNTSIQVTYCSGYFYPFHLEGCWRSGVSNITVIGNIHDNPELLKEREG